MQVDSPEDCHEARSLLNNTNVFDTSFFRIKCSLASYFQQLQASLAYKMCLNNMKSSQVIIASKPIISVTGIHLCNSLCNFSFIFNVVCRKTQAIIIIMKRARLYL